MFHGSVNVYDKVFSLLVDIYLLVNFILPIKWGASSLRIRAIVI